MANVKEWKTVVMTCKSTVQGVDYPVTIIMTLSCERGARTASILSSSWAIRLSRALRPLERDMTASSNLQFLTRRKYRSGYDNYCHLCESP